MHVVVHLQIDFFKRQDLSYMPLSSSPWRRACWTLLVEAVRLAHCSSAGPGASRDDILAPSCIGADYVAEIKTQLESLEWEATLAVSHAVGKVFPQSYFEKSWMAIHNSLPIEWTGDSDETAASRLMTATCTPQMYVQRSRLTPIVSGILNAALGRNRVPEAGTTARVESSSTQSTSASARVSSPPASIRSVPPTNDECTALFAAPTIQVGDFVMRFDRLLRLVWVLASANRIERHMLSDAIPVVLLIAQFESERGPLSERPTVRCYDAKIESTIVWDYFSTFTATAEKFSPVRATGANCFLVGPKMHYLTSNLADSLIVGIAEASGYDVLFARERRYTCKLINYRDDACGLIVPAFYAESGSNRTNVVGWLRTRLATFMEDIDKKVAETTLVYCGYFRDADTPRNSAVRRCARIPVVRRPESEHDENTQ